MITDFTSDLVSDPLYETDFAFTDRVSGLLLGDDAPPHLTNHALELLVRGTSRERVIQALVDSREFREKYTRR